MHGRARLPFVIVGLLAGFVVLVPMAWKVADDVVDLDGCDGPRDWDAGVGPGSCAVPFAAADIGAGDVGFDLVARVGAEGWVGTSYHLTNHTDEWRSIDSSKVEVVDSRGRTIDCYSDNSAVMLSSEPGSTQTLPCGGRRTAGAGSTRCSTTR